MICKLCKIKFVKFVNLICQQKKISSIFYIFLHQIVEHTCVPEATLSAVTPCNEGGGPFGLNCSAMSSEIDGLVYFAPGKEASGRRPTDGRRDGRAETRVHNFIIDYRRPPPPPCPYSLLFYSLIHKSGRKRGREGGRLQAGGSPLLVQSPDKGLLVVGSTLSSLAYLF